MRWIPYGGDVLGGEMRFNPIGNRSSSATVGIIRLPRIESGFGIERMKGVVLAYDTIKDRVAERFLVLLFVRDETIHTFLAAGPVRRPLRLVERGATIDRGVEVRRPWIDRLGGARSRRAAHGEQCRQQHELQRVS